MIDFSNTNFTNIAIHNVGNKLQNESTKLSKDVLNIKDDSLKSLLLKYFLSPFKSNEYYNFHHENEISSNEVYNYVTEMFNDSNEFYQQSVKLAKYLFDQSNHPKIKSGEFYIVYFSNCLFENKMVDAVGLFKSETKDTFLKVLPTNDNFEINYEDGVNINKLDKGCLILNAEKENGYIISIVDTVSKGNEAQFWKENFLNVCSRDDDYYKTKNILNLCKNFVVEKLPEEFKVSKADQVDLLNKSVQYFKENESFNFDDFAGEVIVQPGIIKAFNNYKDEYQQERDVNFTEEFDISDSAVKKQQRIFKSIIKLDKNFHIYIHGNRELIEKGFDEVTGMNYYKVFFKEEN